MKNKFTNQNSVSMRFSFVLEPYCIQSKLFPKALSAICLPLSFDAMLYIHNTMQLVTICSEDPPAGWLISFQFAYSKIPSWRCSSVGFDKCLESCTHPHSITEKFRSPKNSLVQPF